VITEPPGARLRYGAPGTAEPRRHFQTTPTTLLDLEPGRWEIRVAAEDHFPRDSTVELAAGSRDTLRLELTPGGRLRMVGLPSGGRVELRSETGRRVAHDRFPATTELLEPGKWTAVATAPDHASMTAVVRVPAGATREVELALERLPPPAPAPPKPDPPKREEPPPPEPKTGYVRYRVDPASEIVLDGTRVAASSSEGVVPAAPGRAHGLEIRHKGIGAVRTWSDLVVAAGDTVVVEHRFPRGELRIVDQPQGPSEILLDGRSLDVPTPCNLELTPGTYRLQIERPGWSVASAIVMSAAGVTSGQYRPETGVAVEVRDGDIARVRFLLRESDDH
jgi:hypothetical protein